MKIRSEETELLNADGRTDRHDEDNSRFSQCCKIALKRFSSMDWYTNNSVLNSITNCLLTFRHRTSCILGQAFHYSPENAFYIFNQQTYFFI